MLTMKNLFDGSVCLLGNTVNRGRYFKHVCGNSVFRVGYSYNRPIPYHFFKIERLYKLNERRQSRLYFKSEDKKRGIEQFQVCPKHTTYIPTEREKKEFRKKEIKSLQEYLFYEYQKFVKKYWDIDIHSVREAIRIRNIDCEIDMCEYKKRLIIAKHYIETYRMLDMIKLC